jgi:hypothetical protein
LAPLCHTDTKTFASFFHSTRPAAAPRRAHVRRQIFVRRMGLEQLFFLQISGGKFLSTLMPLFWQLSLKFADTFGQELIQENNKNLFSAPSSRVDLDSESMLFYVLK